MLTDEVPLQIHPPLGVDDFEGKIIVTDEDGVDNNKIVAVCQEMEVNGFNIVSMFIVIFACHNTCKIN